MLECGNLLQTLKVSHLNCVVSSNAVYFLLVSAELAALNPLLVNFLYCMHDLHLVCRPKPDVPCFVSSDKN